MDRLGQGDCGLEHAKNNTRLHTGFPSCSLAGLVTSPSHQDTSRGPGEGESEEADADGDELVNAGFSSCRARLVYREVPDERSSVRRAA